MVMVMSRERVRPTRQETRAQLFEAAAAVFAEQGIGAASVEAISSAAGLTRGAFYSNFSGKDDLITAMLADHVEQSVRRHLELLARHRDPDDFMAAFRAVDRCEQRGGEAQGAGGASGPGDPARSGRPPGKRP
jgi:AcrR family transcriptional regulator